MKGERILYFLLIGWVILSLGACSTQKNTRASRSYHKTKVRYNILYNGNVAYEEGLRAIQTAAEDDYTGVLSLYPISDHKAAQSATSQMERTIEKCRKSIKLHSIKSRPKSDPKRRSDPKYRAWLKQEEFNPALSEAWVRLGEAEFHKGDFLGSVGTFNYVIRHYDYDGDVVARCQLMVARAYAEMGWQYEAEDMLSKVQQDALKTKHAHLYGATAADVLLHAGQYKQAIPFLKIAVPHEKRKVYRPRFQYVLAQLYQTQGQRQEAIDAYRKVIRLAPPTVMDFHARLNMAELKGKAGLKGLKSMTRQSKHKDHLDVIYGTMANIWLQAGDTLKALELYQLAIDTAKNATLDKAGILVQAGDLYFDRKQYAEAQPCYREALTIFSTEHAQYKRLQARSEVLDQLILHVNTVTLQDSLQALSLLSEEEQLAAVARVIKAEAEQRQRDSILMAQEQREKELDEGPLSVNTSNMLGGAGAAGGAWYFYNAQLMRQGKQQFQRTWGNRPLEDHWRRMSKSVSVQDPTMVATDSLAATDSIAANDSTLQGPLAGLDAQARMYYQQIPHTEAERQVSDSMICDALTQMERIYRYDLRDIGLADQTLAELDRRFPARQRMEVNEQWPEITARLDSLYEATYAAFRARQYAQVKTDLERAKTIAGETEQPTIMPRFMFLGAVATARTEGQMPFADRLREMVEKYPTHELSAKAKDMLAMMGQGMESKKGSGATDLSDARQKAAEEAAKEAEEAAKQAGDVVPDTKPVVLLVLPKQDEKLLHQLQYEVALFNFEVFLLRDFDLQPRQTPEGMALEVGPFETRAEAEWWIALIRKNTTLAEFIEQNGIMPEAKE